MNNFKHHAANETEINPANFAQLALGQHITSHTDRLAMLNGLASYLPCQPITGY